MFPWLEHAITEIDWARVRRQAQVVPDIRAPDRTEERKEISSWLQRAIHPTERGSKIADVLEGIKRVDAIVGFVRIQRGDVLQKRFVAGERKALHLSVEARDGRWMEIQARPLAGSELTEERGRTTAANLQYVSSPQADGGRGKPQVLLVRCIFETHTVILG